MKGPKNISLSVVCFYFIYFALNFELMSQEIEELKSLPTIEIIERFELVDLTRLGTENKIVSTNRDAASQLLSWMRINTLLPFDLNWQGPYRPSMTIKFWLRNEQAPKQLVIFCEWKDASGRVNKLRDQEVNLLIKQVLEACDKQPSSNLGKDAQSDNPSKR